MNVHLTDRSEKLLNEELTRGEFGSPEEVIEHALELLHSEDKWRDSVRNHIEEGWAQLERGELLTAEESRADMEKRKAAWLANRKS
jgi:Arc/MetJ-type ribon-helix-helix transcriptional regulator